MFDAFRTGYELSCPNAGERVLISLSSFRTIRRLPATTSPVVYQVSYECTCGDEHDSLLSHDDLDWAPLSLDTSLTWTDIMTGRRELVGSEMVALAGDMISRGRWPWVFYCYAESAVRPGFPSGVRVLAPAPDGRQGVVVRCTACRRHSVNLVTPEHLDVPFFNDEELAFVPGLVAGDEMNEAERFRARLSEGMLPTSWTDGNVA